MLFRSPFAVQLPPRLSYTANPQVPPLQSSPSCLYIYSWELEYPPHTLAGTTPSLVYVVVIHLFAVSTTRAETTASKPVRDHAYPLLVFILEILLPTAVSTSFIYWQPSPLLRMSACHGVVLRVDQG